MTNEEKKATLQEIADADYGSPELLDRVSCELCEELEEEGLITIVHGDDWKIYLRLTEKGAAELHRLTMRAIQSAVADDPSPFDF